MRAQFVDQSTGKLIHSAEDIERSEIVIGDRVRISRHRTFSSKVTFTGTIVAVELSISDLATQPSPKELTVFLKAD